MRYTLTTNIDTIDVTGVGANVVTGALQSNAGAADTSTFQTGDTVNGNGNTDLNLVINANAALAVDAIADINNVASVNINLAKAATGDATVDMSEFDSVGQLAITQGSNGQFLDLANAQVGTTYAINLARTVTVDFKSFEADTAAGTTVNLSVAGAGVNSTRTAATQIYANVAAFDFTGTATTDIENINIATSGSNYVAIVDAADLEVLTVTGSGNNLILVNGGVDDLEVDASTSTGTNTIDLFDNLTVGNEVTVLGGTGSDTVRAILAAGTTAATLTGVESAGFTFANASTFNATNSDSLTSVSVIDSTDGTTIVSSDEAANLTFLDAAVATLNLASTGTDGNDAVNASYVSGSKGDLTINLGASYADVDVGAITVTNLTGALTINGAGKSTYGGETAASITNSKASSVTVSTVSSSIDITTVITAAAATAFALEAVNGLTADVNRIDIGKTSSAIAIKSVDLSATGTNSTGTTGSTAVATLNAIDVGSTDTIKVDLVTLTSDADGVVKFTATQAGAGDSVTITKVDATAAEGDGVVIDLSDIDSKASTVSTGAGSATVLLTAAADTFNAGSGNVTVTTVDGADTINAGSGVDTIEMSTSNDGIDIVGFTTKAGGDIAAFDLSAWDAPVDSDGNAISAGGAAALQNLASGAAWDYDTGNILVLTGTIADDAALKTELETYGKMTDIGADGTYDILVAYFDGYSTQLREVAARVDVTGGAGGAGDIDLATVTSDGAELVGTTIGDLVAGNFAFIS